MKKTLFIKIAFAGLLFLSASTGIFAQKSGFSLHFGGAFPTGDFKTPMATIERESAPIEVGMMTGASLGMRYSFKLPVGFNLFVHAELAWNSLDKETKAKYHAVSKTVPQFVNVPLFAGVRYTTPFSEVFGIYAEAACGMDFLIKTQEGWKGETTKYQHSKAFAGDFGLGLTFIKKLSVGAHYYLLGNHVISVKDPKPTTFPIDENMNVRMWMLKATIHM